MILHTNEEMLKSIINDEYGGAKPEELGEVQRKFFSKHYLGKYIRKLELKNPKIILEVEVEGIIEFDNEEEHEAWEVLVKEQWEKNNQLKNKASE